MKIALNAKQKKTAQRIIITAVLLICASVIPFKGIIRLLAFLVPYLLISYDVLIKAARNCIHGQIFDENFLMCIAGIGALAIGEYPEAVLVMLLSAIGNLFEKIAVGKARRSISELMDIRPDSAVVERNGTEETVSPEEVEPGEIIIVKPGERVPIDGTIISGEAMLDKKSLTGESMPIHISPGDEILSGCIDISGVIRIKTSVTYSGSAVNRILSLVEDAQERKAPAESFITKFAKYYTPSVVIAAALLAVLPPLITGAGFSNWLRRALIFLVVSCPCALVISVPLGYFGGIGAASRHGILVKGGNVLDTLSHVGNIVFDKTGTLTNGTFTVTGIYPQTTESELIETVVYAEAYSTHPIALSILAYGGITPDRTAISDYRSIPGKGVACICSGASVAAGNSELMRDTGISVPETVSSGTVVHVAKDGRYLGHITISDSVKSTAKRAVETLSEKFGSRITMFTGDSAAAAVEIGAELGIADIRSEMLPADKVERLSEIMEKADNVKTAFIGDGINDAPVIMRADVGFAMGALGSDAAIEAADVVLTDDDPAKIPIAIEIAALTGRIARENIAFALFVKAAVLILGAFGLAGMWPAMFADVGVSVIAISNSLRTLYFKTKAN